MTFVCCAYSFAPPPTKILLKLSCTTNCNSININSNLSSLRNKPKTHYKLSRHTCYCKHSEEEPELSVLEPDIPWDSGTIWSSYALYLLSFHVPLSFGGLSTLSYVFNQPILDPQTKAVSLLVIQILELISVYWVITQVVRPQYDPLRFFQVKNKARNWVLGSAMGFGFLVLFVFVTSLLIAQTDPGELANNQVVVKEILSSGAVSRTSCVLAYCIVTPLLEEIVYRGFILGSLASQMKWYQAVFISSVIFSAVHFSGESFLQLFVIGCVLGGSYCWTGSLRSPFVIHSLYNALILVIVNLS